MRSENLNPTPNSRDQGIKLGRRLTFWSTGLASVGVAVFAAVSAATLPGTSSTATASVPAPSSGSAASSATTSSASASSATVQATPTPAATQAQPVVVSGGSH
jgi:hypothetical protein